MVMANSITLKPSWHMKEIGLTINFMEKAKYAMIILKKLSISISINFNMMGNGNIIKVNINLFRVTSS